MPPSLTLDELEENFDLLGDWDERYQYIIDLGRKLPPAPPALHDEANLVRGCQSKVWLIAEPDEGRPGALKFIADSDSIIVKGLAALLVGLHSGLTPAEILALPVEESFERLDLKKFLSTNRGSGLGAMIQRMRQIASATAAA